MALKDDYKDYISKTEDKKYDIRENRDGTHSLIDVTEYTQLGDEIRAENINALTKAVNTHTNKSALMIYRNDFIQINANQPIPFDKEFGIGGAFEMINGEIRVMKNVNVLISVYIYKSQGPVESKTFYLQKRKHGVSAPLNLVSYKEVQNGEIMCSIPQFMTNLSAGDSIYVSCKESFHLHGHHGQGEGIMSYLTVQEL